MRKMHRSTHDRSVAQLPRFTLRRPVASVKSVMSVVFDSPLNDFPLSWFTSVNLMKTKEKVI